MMVELGKYAGVVLSAYAATLGLLALLVLATWMRARAVKRRLDMAEARTKRG